MDPRLSALLPGVIVRADHLDLGRVLDYALRKGDLVRLLPGIYAPPNPSFELRVEALLRADPDAVLTGLTAGWAWRWNEAPTLVHAASSRGAATGYAFHGRRVPAEEVVEFGGLRVTSAALTALDLARERGSAAIDDALRRRVPLVRMWEALEAQSGVAGNKDLRRMLRGSRTEPWSHAEREGHRALLKAGVRGWVANHRVAVGPGEAYYLDAAFRKEKLDIEIDGWEYHRSRESFEADRRRDVALVKRGWLVARFTGAWVLENPGAFAETVADLRRRRLRGSI